MALPVDTDFRLIPRVISRFDLDQLENLIAVLRRIVRGVAYKFCGKRYVRFCERSSDTREIANASDTRNHQMQALKTNIFAVVVSLLFVGNAWAGERYFLPGTYKVLSDDGFFTDPARNDREVPYRRYVPQSHVAQEGSGKFPVVVFSHGLGGSRNAAAYLGEHLAGHGFLAVHIQHAGSDENIWKGAKSRREAVQQLKKSIRKYRNGLARFQDVPFVIDQIQNWNAKGPLQNRLDLKAVGMAGHSYGARSTLIAAGQRVGRRGFSFKEPRIKAALPLSPNYPMNGDDIVGLYDDINIPVFHMTGTRDGDPLQRSGNFNPVQRTWPYQKIAARHQYLLVLGEADHATFSGNRLRRGNPKPADERHLKMIRGGAVAFFEAHLKNDSKARIWLQKEYSGFLAQEDRYTFKSS